jgi:hypothetical protein
MKEISAQLKSILDQHMETLQQIPEDEFASKPSPSKWSKKEIMGHLIDSAQNNIRRFVTAQYEDNPKIAYNQDRWVTISVYQQWDTVDIIRLWCLLNIQICYILENTDRETATRNCTTDINHTIEWLARDYNKHLLHHLHVVLDLEPVAYP